MKKLLIGCLIFLILLIGLTIGVGYYVFVKVKEFAEGFDMSKAVEQVQQIDRDFPWSPPAEPTALEPTRYQDYLAVRDQVGNRLMQVGLFAELAQAAEEERQANINPLQILGLARDLPMVLRDTTTAFREQEMSFREFGHHSRETLRALRAGGQMGIPEMAEAWETLRGVARFVDQEIDRGGDAGMIDASREFDTIEIRTLPLRSIEVVRPHVKDFQDSPARFVIELLIIRLLGDSETPTPAPAATQPVPVQPQP